MALNFLRTILAGDESALPQDTPSARIDTSGGFPFVGALSITNGDRSFTGSGVALSPRWVLTAGHNADLNDDGLPDSGLVTTFHLPGAGSFSHFGDTGGGIVLRPYLPWIHDVTGLPVPEPGTGMLLLAVIVLLTGHSRGNKPAT